MRHAKVSRTLGRHTSHRIAMLRNLATALFTHRKIETTEARAKELSKFADNLIATARKGDLSSKRRVFIHIKDREVAKQLFDVIAPQYKEGAGENERRGGYTRIVKLGFRKGDAASMALVELV